MSYAVLKENRTKRTVVYLFRLSRLDARWSSSRATIDKHVYEPGAIIGDPIMTPDMTSWCFLPECIAQFLR